MERRQAYTDPTQTAMVAGEVAEYIYDAARDLGDGQAPTNPSVELRDVATGTAVADGAALDAPAIEGTRLFVRVAGVQPKRKYELRIGFDHTNPRVPGERTVKIHQILGAG